MIYSDTSIVLAVAHQITELYTDKAILFLVLSVDYIVSAADPLQKYVGRAAVSEAVAHAMQDLFITVDCETALLADHDVSNLLVL